MEGHRRDAGPPGGRAHVRSGLPADQRGAHRRPSGQQAHRRAAGPGLRRRGRLGPGLRGDGVGRRRLAGRPSRRRTARSRPGCRDRGRGRRGPRRGTHVRGGPPLPYPAVVALDAGGRGQGTRHRHRRRAVRHVRGRPGPGRHPRAGHAPVRGADPVLARARDGHAAACPPGRRQAMQPPPGVRGRASVHRRGDHPGAVPAGSPPRATADHPRPVRRCAGGGDPGPARAAARGAAAPRAPHGRFRPDRRVRSAQLVPAGPAVRLPGHLGVGTVRRGRSIRAGTGGRAAAEPARDRPGRPARSRGHRDRGLQPDQAARCGRQRPQ